MKCFEIEQKFRLRDPGAIRSILKRNRAKKISAGKECNEFFDRKKFLRKQKIALRLRHWGGRKALLTLKGPRLKAKFTKRFEIETPILYPLARKLLKRLGLKICMRYSKQRETYRWGSALVVLDHLKGFGWFLEIEAAPRKIVWLAKEMRLGSRDREEKSYLQMLFGWIH